MLERVKIIFHAITFHLQFEDVERGSRKNV